MPALQICYHDHCFDGVASAATFLRFYREKVKPLGERDVTFQGMAHKAGQLFGEDVFQGDENAVVDFRYTQDPRLTWWFDHHQSAFESPADEAQFRADRSGKKFWDPARKSCTKFIADVVSERFGWDRSPLRELIDWAEVIDGALFPDAQMAVELKEPALRLMTFIENNRDNATAERFIGDLVSRPLAEIAAEPYVTEPLGPVLEQHARNVDAIKKAAKIDGGVVLFDVADENIGAFNKFISYYLFPETRYSVGVTLGQRAKISVGSNPWARVPRTHDISKICERYGGGGHPVVGAVSVPKGELERAREIAREIVAELQSG